MCLKRLLHLLLLQEPLKFNDRLDRWVSDSVTGCAAFTCTQKTLLGLNQHFQTSTSLEGLQAGRIMAQGAPVATPHAPMPHFMSGCI